MDAETYYNDLITEVTQNPSGLSAGHYQTLRRYYHALATHERQRPFYRYNWLRRTAPMVALLSQLPRREQPWRLLDAGCGVGTETLLWASLRPDIAVVGVDISPERLDTAVARQAHHEQKLGRPLNVQFLDANVFDVLQTQPFDMVWTMEALSHIDPAEAFLTAVAANIGPSGALVISDSHLANPQMAWRIYKIRQRAPDGSYKTSKTTSSGESISYANERLFTVGRLATMLRQTGFKTVETHLHIFFPPSFARHPRLFAWSRGVDGVLGQMPLVRNLGGIYTVVAFPQQMPGGVAANA